MSTDMLRYNLIRLRNKIDLSQEDVATRVGLSRSAYANIETGRTEPGNDLITKLAVVFNVTFDEFYQVSALQAGIRFRSTKQLKTRESIIADAHEWLSYYKELEDLLQRRSSDGFVQRFASDEFEGLTAREAAAKARIKLSLDRVLDERIVQEPVRNIYGLMESRAGIKILARPVASEHFFGLSVASGYGGPAIVVNTWDRITVERWIFTTAHEFGHLILHRSSYLEDKKDEDEKQEREANEFASHFLMPQELFRDEWERAEGLDLLERVRKVKRIFGVSHKAVIYRLTTECGYKPSLWGWYKKEYERQYKKKLNSFDEAAPQMQWQDFYWYAESKKANEKAPLEPDDFTGGQFEGMVLEAISEGLIDLNKGAVILQIDPTRLTARLELKAELKELSYPTPS